ncbi:MAG TPA: hypothetical protein VGK25_00145, partial [Ignavibacteria bacterium]
MKKTLLLITFIGLVLVSRTQVIFNEVYTDPAAGNNEFFELYNTSTSSSPLSLDHYTIVTYFETPKEQGFCVMDLPNLSIAPKGYFVGASDLPFDYQGVTNSTAADFSWNSSAFTSNNGYVKKWILQSGNLGDGNVDYDEENLPANFNDFFFRRTGVGATYTIFLYNNGVLINALVFGTGGLPAVIPSIITMPPLFVDMSGSSPDFTIDFSSYSSIPVETVMQDAGNDNGYFRKADGLCGGWLKSDAQAQHTPQVTNGYVDGYSGDISVSAIIQRGSIATGSKIVYDVLSAPSTSFPVQLDVYKDNGLTLSRLDANDNYVESNTEYQVTDGSFTTWFTPYDMNMLVVVKSNVGCIDKIMFVPNVSTLPVKLIYFQGNMENNKITLHWNVAQNELSNRFEVERSADGKNFTSAGVVVATTKSGSEYYSFTETTDNDKIYYRLKMYNKKDVAEFSKTLVFQTSGSNTSRIKIINNPVTEKLTMSFSLTNN